MSWVLVGELIVIFWFFFHPIIVILIIYWILFREWPFPRGYKWSSDLKFLNSFRKAVMQSLLTDPNPGGKSGSYYYSEEDFYDAGEASPDDRARIRYPKNR
jgi:hypothetical protein